MIRIGYSRYNAFKSCKEMYRQQYHIPLEEAEHEFTDQFWTAVGQGQHSVIQASIDNNITEDNLEEFLEAIFLDLKSIKFCLYDEMEWETCDNMPDTKKFHKTTYIKNFPTYFVEPEKWGYKDLWMARNVWAKRVREQSEPVVRTLVEKGWTVKGVAEEYYEKRYKGYLLNGKTDLVVETDTGVIILDFKRKYNKEWHTEEQLLFYVMLLGKKVTGMGYWCIKENEIHYIVPKKSELKKLVREILAFKEYLVENSIEDEWEATGGGHCQFCPIHTTCEESQNNV